MKTHIGRISEMALLNDETCLRIKGLLVVNLLPGQVLQVFNPESTDLLPVILHPCYTNLDDPLYCGTVPKSWLPGSEVHVRGPRGNGFHLPPLARRVALTTLDVISINRILPLADLALENGAEVTLLTDSHPTQLAPEIELLPLAELSQIKNWVDYLGVSLPPEKVDDLILGLATTPGKSLSYQAEILVDVPMVCDESSACGACAVFTSRGWKLACKDGPVFSLGDLMAEGGSHGG